MQRDCSALRFTFVLQVRTECRTNFILPGAINGLPMCHVKNPISSPTLLFFVIWLVVTYMRVRHAVRVMHRGDIRLDDPPPPVVKISHEIEGQSIIHWLLKSKVTGSYTGSEGLGEPLWIFVEFFQFAPSVFLVLTHPWCYDFRRIVRTCVKGGHSFLNFTTNSIVLPMHSNDPPPPSMHRPCTNLHAVHDALCTSCAFCFYL